MGAVEDAVDDAANFIGPFVDNVKDVRYLDTNAAKIVNQALVHLEAINKADLVADPTAPYDASLAGVVYGLLDLITSIGVLPNLSTGVAFSQRPRSVLSVADFPPSDNNPALLLKVVEVILPLFHQDNTGVQPLVSQRVLPDIISGLAELALSPHSDKETRERFLPLHLKLFSSISTSRLLPLLTTFLQQPLPPWFRPVLARELATIPLRQHGIRHTIEFLSLSYLAKNSQVPQAAAGSQSQVPIPLEAVAQASRLLVLPAEGISQHEWLQNVAPQLWSLLDGDEGRELSRAAGHIIAGGILSKKATGAPGTSGWNLFAQPLLQAISPNEGTQLEFLANRRVTITQERDLELALKRLATITASYSHAGLIRRLIGPLILPLWALLNFSKSRPSLGKEWSMLPQTILTRYLAIACDPKQVDDIATGLFWDGTSTWCFGPGNQGGVEVRMRNVDEASLPNVDSVFTQVEQLDSRIQRMLSLLADASIADDIVGSIFLQTTKRWLSLDLKHGKPVIDEDDDPLAALANAKLSEAMVNKFKEQFVRSPQHILELCEQLLHNFVQAHQTRVKTQSRSALLREGLRNIVPRSESDGRPEETSDEDIASFATSIVNMLISSPNFQQTPGTKRILASVMSALIYLREPQPHLPIPPLLANAADALSHVIQPPLDTSHTQPIDSLAEYRTTLHSALSELTAPDPPNRAWALTTLRTLIQDLTAFTVIDVPSLAHMLVSISLADPESYVHTAAVPVLVDLAVRAANPVVPILVDAFVDIDEHSLKLSRAKETDEKMSELQHALDSRLRVGEVLSRFASERDFWHSSSNQPLKYRLVRKMTEACLSLASRRGQRKQTLQARTQVLSAQQKTREEEEQAWDGPIPNLLDPEDNLPQDRADRDVLLKIVQGWEDTGIEEDVRMRTSALSVLSILMEQHLLLLDQAAVDAALQTVILVLTIETGEVKAIVRRAAVLVVMGLLRGLDAALDEGKEGIVSLELRKQEELKKVLEWVRHEDADTITRDHATSVVEGLDVLRMKKVYKIRDEGMRLGPSLSLEGNLRGLELGPPVSEGMNELGKKVIEEIE